MEINKRFALILAALLAILCVGNIEAKTTKRTTTSKPKTTTTTNTSLWHGDVPSAEIIYSFFYKGSSRYESMLKSHGYELVDNVNEKSAVKPGFCKMEFHFTRAGAALTIELEDTSGQEWLYNDIKKFIENDRELRNDYTVEMKDNFIYFNWETII